MQETAQANLSRGAAIRESLLQRKYVVPFVLACIVLFCNTACGINSIIGYNTNILLQSGLSDVQAHWGYVIFTVVNFLMTIIGLTLVDRKGRRFLLITGTAGIIVSLTVTALLFLGTEKSNIDVHDRLQSAIQPDQTLSVRFDPAQAAQLLGAESRIDPAKASLVVVYSYGDFTAESTVAHSNEEGAPVIHVSRESAVPANKIEAFFKNPFADVTAARTAPLKIEKALVSPLPDASHGWLVAITLYIFMSFYAIGPGVCVWLALSELMPTRIRSNGMSIALVINQMVSTTLAAIFLPIVANHGYSTIFFLFAGFTVIYFVTATFFLPETKGKTLEEIEEYFEGAKASA